MKQLKATPQRHFLEEDFEDFFEGSLCGYIFVSPSGNITRSNKKITEWTGYTADEICGRKFTDLLTVGGKIYYATHLQVLLKLQGFFEEVMLELDGKDDKRSLVLVNALEKRDENNTHLFTRYIIIKASERLLYEKTLQLEKNKAEDEAIKQKEIAAVREQLIAVLGHDLRNPLSAISMVAELLESSANDETAPMVAILKRSSFRMAELINNIMDFAKTRLGEALVLVREDADMQPFLQQVIEELQLIYPQRKIITVFEFNGLIYCDPNRISQLFSNLLANALTHGASDTPVTINATNTNGHFSIQVKNEGEMIPPELRDHIFSPFKRPGFSKNKEGLGLGLYIAAEIAKAHGGQITFISTDENTVFILQIPISRE